MSGLRFNWPAIAFWSVMILMLIVGTVGILTLPPVEGVDY